METKMSLLKPIMKYGAVKIPLPPLEVTRHFTWYHFIWCDMEV